MLYIIYGFLYTRFSLTLHPSLEESTTAYE